MDKDITLFDAYKMSDLLREIKERSENKKNQLDILYTDIRKHITDKNDAIMFLPRIKEFMDVGVKNDEQLVKLAAVVQKFITLDEIDKSAGGLSEEEKQQLLASLSNDMSTIHVETKNDIEVKKPVPQ